MRRNTREEVRVSSSLDCKRTTPYPGARPAAEPRSLTQVRLERLRRLTCKEVAYCRIDVKYCDDVERCVTTS